MKLVNAIEAFKNKKAVGRFILIYGDTNVGKTCSSMQSLSGTTAGIFTEPRDIEENIIASGRDLVKDPFPFDYWKDFNDLRVFLADHNNFKGVDNILFDGISHGMYLIGTEASHDEFMSEYGTQVKTGTKIDNSLAKEMKMSWSNYDTMAQGMLTIINLLGQLAKTGKTIVCTARLDEPSNAIKATGKNFAPLYKGKLFGKDVTAWFDLVGIVEDASTLEIGKAEVPPNIIGQTQDTEPKPIYKRKVPKVSFDKPDAVTKRTGIAPNILNAKGEPLGWNKLPLDFGVICGNGKVNNTDNNNNTGE